MRRRTRFSFISVCLFGVRFGERGAAFALRTVITEILAVKGWEEAGGWRLYSLSLSHVLWASQKANFFNKQKKRGASQNG